MLKDIFFTEAAWRLIPPVTSLICLTGLVGALQLVGVARYDLRRHSRDELRPVAVFLQRRAFGRSLALLLLVASGILFSIGTWLLPIPETGWPFICLWINHYFVGSLGVILTTMALLDTRDRLRM